MLKVCSNHSIVQYVDYMGGPSKRGDPERSLHSHLLRSITAQTHFRRYRHCHVRLFFGWFLNLNFFSGICHCETDAYCAVFLTTQKVCKEISVKCFSQGHNDVLPRMGIESAILRSLTWRFNQLSYAVAI